jgi:hypothetical protein
MYFNMPDSATLADLVTAAGTIITDVDAVTDGQILGVSLDVQITLPTVKTAPVAGAEIERGGLFNFSQENVKYRFGILIPAFKKSLIVNGRINLAATAVTTFIGAVTAIGGDLDFISTGGNLLVAFTDALINFRKHRKAESRRSYEV